MKKNVRIVQINGFRGLFITLFIIACLAAGFVAFPAFLSMHVWNYLATKTLSFPTISFAEGLLLWGIILMSIFIFNKRKFIVSFNSQQELSDEEIKSVITKIKERAVNHKIIMPENITPSNIEKNDLKQDNNEIKTHQD